MYVRAPCTYGRLLPPCRLRTFVDISVSARWCSELGQDTLKGHLSAGIAAYCYY